MKTIETRITIHAPIDRVWEKLTNFPAHHAWNPFIMAISGEKEVGKTLTIQIKPIQGAPMTFKPKVLVFNQNQELRWKGVLFFSALFAGEHYFILQQISPETTELIHGKKFSGLLLGMLGKMLVNTQKGFELMNEALKKECECNC
jgi:hypothetical protein